LYEHTIIDETEQNCHCCWQPVVLFSCGIT
jgi:hypothetical protein